MFAARILFLSICYVAYASQSSEELDEMMSKPEGILLLREAIKNLYNEDKLDVISNLVNDYDKDIVTNITLVGSQNIYDDNGKIVEIRTVELYIPQNIKESDANRNNYRDNDDDDDDDDENSLSELKKVFNVVSKLGFSMEAATNEYDRKGNLVTRGYINEDLEYGYLDGIHYINKTIEGSMDSVNNKIKEWQDEKKEVAVHKYDSNDKFLIEESHVIPENVATIHEISGKVDSQVVDSALEGLATIYLSNKENRQDIPKKLSEFLRLKHPNCDFTVFEKEPTSWFLTKDFMINIRFDLTDTNENIEYSIFGINNKTLTRMEKS